MEDYENERKEYKYCSCGKKCYTENEAGYLINVFKRRNRRKKSGNGKIPRRKYLCKICRFWHLTSLENYYTDYKSKKSSFK